jgi:hypothetical protein
VTGRLNVLLWTDSTAVYLEAIKAAGLAADCVVMLRSPPGTEERIRRLTALEGSEPMEAGS